VYFLGRQWPTPSSKLILHARTEKKLSNNEKNNIKRTEKFNLKRFVSAQHAQAPDYNRFDSSDRGQCHPNLSGKNHEFGDKRLGL
jgi:hypothetical protein